MKQTAVIVTVLSGLCFLPACFARDYFLVETPMSWDEAQDYCRRTYTDLVSIHNEEDLAKVNELRGGKAVWIGLTADLDAWKWSLENPDYYGEGEAEFRKWQFGEPDNNDKNDICVSLLRNGEWGDQLCHDKYTFFCYTNGTETSSRFIHVNMKKTWMEAQRYCREHYTDLACVRNQEENDQLLSMITEDYTWIGLYRKSWKWSDGSAYSSSHWHPNTLSAWFTYACVTVYEGTWVNSVCTKKWPYICYHDVRHTERKVVKVVLKKSDPSVDMEELKDDMLAKLHQRLQDHGLSGSVTLRWVKHADGKTFHKIEDDEEEEGKEGSCPSNSFF